MAVRFGREIAGDLRVLEQREWLVTNGAGGYGSGTAAGSITRGYHGLLVAALQPPTGRQVMLVKLEETAVYRGVSYALTTNRWASGAVSPEGYINIQSWELEGSIPRWVFACGDALIEKRVWMEHGSNTTYVAYTVLSAVEPVRLTAGAIANNRPFHNTGQLAWPATAESLPDVVRVRSGGDGARPLQLRMPSASVAINLAVYRDFALPAETERGLRDREDHVHVADFTVTIAPGATALFAATSEDVFPGLAGALERRQDRDRMLLSKWQQARVPGAPTAPDWIRQLVLAADQFVVERPSPEQPDGKSVIAGYHWFEDWGRDTMISLPGLALTTGRPEIAAPILRTFARFIDQGMLPNRFPDAATQPEYNTIDATLWYFQAIRAYHDATSDDALLADLYPKLEQILDAHVAGTRYQIRVDPADGLLRGGQPGVQLTWMDAKVGGNVITPRIGKPVEVNALWYNALLAMVRFARRLNQRPDRWQAMADTARQGFARFWNPATGYCFDVLDGPQGNEALLRPNQLFAVSLPESPLTTEQQKAVVDACARMLLTSYGLRSLEPGEPDYRGAMTGDQFHRDSAYHQGTVWAWLLGPFLDALLRIHGDAAEAARILGPLADHLQGACLGSVSEVFDGDAPFEPRGCIAQAWSVAEALRSFDRIERLQAASAAAPPPHP